MAKAWREVMASPQYQALGAAEREAARNQYFQEVIAPQAGEQAELARRQFDAQYGPKQPKREASRAARQPGANPTDGMGFVQKAAAGLGKAYVDTYRGAKQLGTELGKYVVDSNNVLLGPERHQRLSNALGSSLAQQQSEIDESKKTDQALMNTGAGFGGNVLGYASTMILPGAAVRGTAAARAIMPATVAGNAVQGAVLGGLQPVATGENRLANATLGGAAGGAGAGVSSLLSKSANSAKGAISDSARKAYITAKKHGITLTAPQLIDSPFLKRLQHMTRNMPFTGAQERYTNQLADFTRAASRTIGEDTGSLTPDVFARAKLNNAARYDAVTSNNSMLFDTGLAKRLADLKQEAKDYADDKVQGEISRMTKRIFDQIDPETGMLPGEAYQSIMSNIGQITKNGGESARYLGDLRSSLKNAMDRSISPADRAEWALANQTHGNLRTLRDLVGKAEANDGIISPALLMGRVASSNVGKESLATGNGNALAELAAIGQRIKPQPTSGTAENLLSGGVFNPVNWPAYGAGAAIGAPISRAIDSELLVKYLMRQNPGMTREAAARLARMAVPAATSVGVSAAAN